MVLGKAFTTLEPGSKVSSHANHSLTGHPATEAFSTASTTKSPVADDISDDTSSTTATGLERLEVTTDLPVTGYLPVLSTLPTPADDSVTEEPIISIFSTSPPAPESSLPEAGASGFPTYYRPEATVGPLQLSFTPVSTAESPIAYVSTTKIGRETEEESSTIPLPAVPSTFFPSTTMPPPFEYLPPRPFSAQETETTADPSTSTVEGAVPSTTPVPTPGFSTPPAGAETDTTMSPDATADPLAAVIVTPSLILPYLPTGDDRTTDSTETAPTISASGYDNTAVRENSIDDADLSFGSVTSAAEPTTSTTRAPSTGFNFKRRQPGWRGVLTTPVPSQSGISGSTAITSPAPTVSGSASPTESSPVVGSSYTTINSTYFPAETTVSPLLGATANSVLGLLGSAARGGSSAGQPPVVDVRPWAHRQPALRKTVTPRSVFTRRRPPGLLRRSRASTTAAPPPEDNAVDDELDGGTQLGKSRNSSIRSRGRDRYQRRRNRLRTVQKEKKTTSLEVNEAEKKKASVESRKNFRGSDNDKRGVKRNSYATRTNRFRSREKNINLSSSQGSKNQTTVEDNSTRANVVNLRHNPYRRRRKPPGGRGDKSIPTEVESSISAEKTKDNLVSTGTHSRISDARRQRRLRYRLQVPVRPVRKENDSITKSTTSSRSSSIQLERSTRRPLRRLSRIKPTTTTENQEENSKETSETPQEISEVDISEISRPLEDKKLKFDTQLTSNSTFSFTSRRRVRPRTSSRVRAIKTSRKHSLLAGSVDRNATSRRVQSLVFPKYQGEREPLGAANLAQKSIDRSKQITDKTLTDTGRSQALLRKLSAFGDKPSEENSIETVTVSMTASASSTAPTSSLKSSTSTSPSDRPSSRLRLPWRSRRTSSTARPSERTRHRVRWFRQLPPDHP